MMGQPPFMGAPPYGQAMPYGMPQPGFPQFQAYQQPGQPVGGFPGQQMMYQPGAGEFNVLFLYLCMNVSKSTSMVGEWCVFI